MLWRTPEHDNNEGTSHVEFYTKGGTQYGAIGFGLTGDMSKFENDMYIQAMKAYREDFPELAKKTHPASGA